MNKAFGTRVVLVAGVVLAAVPFRPDSLLAQSRRFTSGVALVPLTVTVTDRAGRYMPDLTAADFAIFEEGRRQAISHFASGDAPIDMGFLLDTSGSMRDNLPLAQKAARGLVQQLRAGDRGAVAGIGSTVSLHQPMTSDLARVDEALQSTQARGRYCPLRCVVCRAPAISAGAAKLHRSQASGRGAAVGWHRHVEPRDVRGCSRSRPASRSDDLCRLARRGSCAVEERPGRPQDLRIGSRPAYARAGIGGTAVQPAHGARTARDLRCHRRGAEPPVRDRVPAESGSRRDVSPHLSGGAAARASASRALVPATTRSAAAPASARHPTVARSFVDEGSTCPPSGYDTCAARECDRR